MLSRFFIDRPVLSNVIALLMILIGAVALLRLPVAQYPDVVPPTVQVTTRYPGASARDVVNSVALPIEQQVNGVQNMLYMQSTSTSDGSYTLTVTFDIGTDVDLAQVLVQNRVAAALSSLPQAVQTQGVTTQKRSTSILQIVTLSSSNGQYDGLFLSNFATIALKDELARLPGVGNVNIFGAGQYSMRIWLDPDLLQARGLMAQDVVQAIQQQSQDVPAGQVGMPPAPKGQAFQYTLNLAGRLQDVSAFEDVVVKAGSNGDLVRVRDLGRVELGAQTYGQSLSFNGRPAAGIAIYLTPGANALDVAQRVRTKMEELSAGFPKGIEFDIPFDTTKFVKASIAEVYKTLIETAILVLLVILVFVQDWRAMLVPATTVPVTIIGTFAAMAALGFSINLSTLFAIVLAIGIVVDDAIVVVEGVSRNIDRGMNARDAAVTAMGELLAPIIGITLVLLCVFLPASFLPGLTGRMYAQFALVIAATGLISAVNAATLKPTQCALWLRPAVPLEQRNRLYRAFNSAYAWLEHRYTGLMAFLVRHSGATVLAGALLIAVAVYGFARIPTSFVPIEDQGYLLVGVQLPDGAALGRTEAVLKQVETLTHTVPGVDKTVAIAGISTLDNNASLANAGVVYVILKDWSVRGAGQDLRSIYERLLTSLNTIDAADTFVLPPPPIQGIGNAAGFTMQLELRDGSFDLNKLQGLTRTIVADGQAQSGLSHLVTSMRAQVPQLDAQLDRTKASILHVSPGDVFQTLGAYLGSAYVAQFNQFGRVFQVYAQADAPFRLRPSDIDRLSVRSSNGDMVPLGTLLRIQPAVGPSLIGLYNLHPTATIVGTPATGFSSGQALRLMSEIADHRLPPGTSYEWTAMSYQEQLVGGQMYAVFGLALLLVYLVLAAQYESWLAPGAVILAVPLALLGPVAALWAVGAANNLYTQIGLVLLIALSAKNAILIVEVARSERRRAGRSIVDAALEGARARFRPILMTSFAFILGVVPLLVATGAGASARASIGITVFSGMLASTCLAVLFAPCLFVVLQRAEETLKARNQAGSRSAS